MYDDEALTPPPLSPAGLGVQPSIRHQRSRGLIIVIAANRAPSFELLLHKLERSFASQAAKSFLNGALQDILSDACAGPTTICSGCLPKRGTATAATTAPAMCRALAYAVRNSKSQAACLLHGLAWISQAVKWQRIAWGH